MYKKDVRNLKTGDGLVFPHRAVVSWLPRSHLVSLPPALGLPVRAVGCSCRCVPEPLVCLNTLFCLLLKKKKKISWVIVMVRYVEEPASARA